MSDNHTKGPWHVEYELDENKEKTDLIFVAHTETECDMTAVAHLLDMSATTEEMKANAYLIAAAPEMLEILEKCLKDELNRRKKLLNKSTAAAYSDARVEKMKEIINKAKGLNK